MSPRLRPLAIAAGIGLLPAAFAAPQTPWPALEMPAGARASLVAGDALLDGHPCRVQRFEVAAPVDEVLQFYRASFRATHLIETRVDGLPVIATRRGDHFLTLRLQPSGGSVRVTAIVTALNRARSRSAAARDTEALMPADTVVVSSLQSNDAGRRALTVVGINRNSVAANRAHVLHALRDRGFAPRREEPGGDRRDDAVSTLLSSSTEEALLAIADAGPYRAVLVQRTTEAKR